MSLVPRGRKHPGIKADILGNGLEIMRRQSCGPLDHRFGGLFQGAAATQIDREPQAAASEMHPVGVALHQRYILRRHSQPFRDHLGKYRFMPCPCDEVPVDIRTFPVASMAIFIRSENTPQTST